MQDSDRFPLDWERLEYHGSTVVERIQSVSGSNLQRDWLLFDTVEEAADFFYENQASILKCRKCY